MLKSIRPEQSIAAPRTAETVTSPPILCEACGKSVPREQAMNIILVVGSPGHPDLPPFQCPGGGDSYGDHWACSVECWKTIAHACIDEHMHAILLYHRKKVGL